MRVCYFDFPTGLIVLQIITLKLESRAGQSKSEITIDGSMAPNEEM
jgi:hypothetical protein